eukprot:4897791-Prymnesium_polylepis.2
MRQTAGGRASSAEGEGRVARGRAAQLLLLQRREKGQHKELLNPSPVQLRPRHWRECSRKCGALGCPPATAHVPTLRKRWAVFSFRLDGDCRPLAEV